MWSTEKKMQSPKRELSIGYNLITSFSVSQAQKRTQYGGGGERPWSGKKIFYF